MRPDDLALLRRPADPTLTPDGARAAFVVSRIDLEADAYRSRLWWVPTDGSAPARPLTHGPRDSEPAYAPDGRHLAFLRAGEEGPAQLHVMPSDGGEPRLVCEHPLGAGAITWHPDSTRITYVARVPEEGRYERGDDASPDKEPPRRITTLRYERDGLGYTIDRRAHVFVVDALAEDAEPVQLTHGDFDHEDPVWSPDGGLVACVSARHAERDTDLGSDVLVVPAAGGDARVVTRGDLPASQPAFTPDGETLVFLAQGTVDEVGRNPGLWRVPVSGDAAPRRLTDAEPHHLGDPHGGSRQPLLVDGDSVVVPRLHRGAVQLVRVDLESGAPVAMVEGQRQVGGYARAGDVLVAVIGTGTSAGELVAIKGGDERVLTDVGALLARQVALREPVELEGKSDDGYPVHGWLVKPAGTGPFPVLLNVHGGPFAAYGWSLFDDAQVYAGAGYAVVMGNPRGSAGYGEAHSRAIVGAMGDRDGADVMALVDAALADPDLDGDHVGVMGGSYGGWMTSWLAGHTDRFVAGISERAVNAFDSFEGSSDIGSFFARAYCGGEPDALARQSPLTYAEHISTPLLLIHSEHDWRCPVEQAKRLYVALKRRGVDTELLLFPGEGHELSRSGLPSHRAARFAAILDWWQRHLR